MCAALRIFESVSVLKKIRNTDFFSSFSFYFIIFTFTYMYIYCLFHLPLPPRNTDFDSKITLVMSFYEESLYS
jgi:hypothetical protein